MDGVLNETWNLIALKLREDFCILFKTSFSSLYENDSHYNIQTSGEADSSLLSHR